MVRITLDSYPGPQNVGILMAQQRGYFADAGILVEIHHPVFPGRPVEYVVGGSANISISHEPQVVLSQKKGAPVVAVGSLVSQPTAAMIWLKKSQVGGIADLKGKTIAISGIPFEKSLLQGVLAQAGLAIGDVKVERAGYELVPALLSGRADAIFGSWNLQGTELEARGLKPVITRLQDLGVPPYEELMLIARRDFESKYPRAIRDFMSAMARGTAAAMRNPKAAAKLIVNSEGEAHLRVTEAQLEATLPLFSRSGKMNSREAGQLVKWMHEEDLLRQEPPVSAFLAGDFLGEGK